MNVPARTTNASEERDRMMAKNPVVILKNGIKWPTSPKTAVCAKDTKNERSS